MAAPLTDEQRSIRDTARAFLRDACGFETLRRFANSSAGWDAALWHTFSGELGFAGLAIPEHFGGSGLAAPELALVAEELGAALAPIPWFETAVLAASILLHANATAHLAAIAAGRLTATLALRDTNAAPLPAGIGPRIDGGVLRGTAYFVPFGAHADLLVVAAREQSLSLLAIPSTSAGVRIQPLCSLDVTRPLAHVHFHDVPAEPLRAGPPNCGLPALEKTLSLGAAILAAEQVGGMQRTLDELVAYAMQRVQFGRLIGSFQAIKHRMADMKLRLEAARSATAWAAASLADGTADAPTACAAARAYCTDAYLDIAADGIQLHGGIGFTWDHHAHFFFKRARSSATLLDPPAVQREQIARLLLDEPAEGIA